MPTLSPTRMIALLLAAGISLSCNGRGESLPESASRDAGAEVAQLRNAAVRDACSLITTAEVEEILQAAVTAKPKGESGWSACYYESRPGGPGFSLKVHWTGGTDELAATKSAMQVAPTVLRDRGVEAGGMLALQPVEGLGEEAYFNPIAGSYVRQGDVLMEFDLRLMMMNSPSRDSTVANWRRLAGSAIGRL